MRRHRLLCIVAGFAFCLFPHTAASYPFVVHPIQKIRPLDKPDSVRDRIIHIAGGEYEAVIFGVYNDGPDLLRITEIALQTSGDGETHLGTELFLIDYVTITKRSLWFEGADVLGRWPDPLIPLRSPAENGTYVLAPVVDVPPGENRTFLLDFRMPRGEKGGEEESWSILVRSDSLPDMGLRLSVRERPFDLPRVPALSTAFGFGWSTKSGKHTMLSKVAPQEDQLLLDYLHLLARHRISVYSTPAAVGVERSGDGSVRLDWTEFDRITGGLLDGSLFPDAPPSTSFRAPIPPKDLTGDEQIRFYSEVASHARERGWLDRMYYYLPDEPLRSMYPEVIRQAEAIRAADAGIRTLATEPFSRILEGFVDIWCPDIIYIGDSIPLLPFLYRNGKIVGDWQPNPQPQVYERRRAAGEETWLYTCSSAVMLNYPNLFIDSSAQHHRVIPWLAYRYGFTGLLYWNVNYNYRGSRNPWETQWQFSSNGDGNLLYPGLPEHPRIAKHMPIPSLRLKILREGFEDYEYLALLSEAGDPTGAMAAAKSSAPRALRWEEDARALDKTRDSVAQAISERAATESP